METDNYLGKNVMLLNSIYGSKPKDIAKKLGVTKQHYSLMLSGKADMKLKYLIQISEHFGVNLETLVNKDLTSETQKFLNDSFNIALPINMEDSENSYLNKKISELDLTTRVIGCLESLDLFPNSKISGLVKYSERELGSLRQFGNTSLREVRRKLKEVGLYLSYFKSSEN